MTRRRDAHTVARGRGVAVLARGSDMPTVHNVALDGYPKQVDPKKQEMLLAEEEFEARDRAALLRALVRSTAPSFS
ncbi:MAG: hypothetical protein HY047_00360 [Acidobacteria bacterium]|nr:hypothetical protein [Acidobacteriota bacterium]